MTIQNRSRIGRGSAFGLTASIIALGAALMTGTAANAAVGSISPTTGSESGGTNTSIAIPMLSGDVYAQNSAIGQVFLGEDGNIYRSNGSRIGAPAGVTFKDVAASIDKRTGEWVVNAIGADGAAYVSHNTGTFERVNVPAPAQAIDGIAFIGADGNAYTRSGSRIAAPAGVSFAEATGTINGNGGYLIAAVAKDGAAYASTNLGTFTRVTAPAPTQTGNGIAVLGSDGNVYRASGGRVPAPAGVTFKSVSGAINESNVWRISAVAKDGKAYTSNNFETFAPTSVPAPAQTAGGVAVLGTNGNLYGIGGKQVPAPAGVKFKSVSAAIDRNNSWTIGGIAMDGTAYASDNFSTLAKARMSAPTVTGVSFGGTPAKSFSRSGTTVSAVTPKHEAGPVDVTVRTNANQTFTRA